MNQTSNSGPSIEELPRELDSRGSDRIEARPLWHARDNRVSVSVKDTKAGSNALTGGKRFGGTFPAGLGA